MSRNFVTAEGISKIRRNSYNYKYGPQMLVRIRKGTPMSDETKDGEQTTGDTTRPSDDTAAAE